MLPLLAGGFEIEPRVVLQMHGFIDLYSAPRFLPRATSLTYGFDRIVLALWNMLISGYGFHEFVWEALC